MKFKIRTKNHVKTHTQKIKYQSNKNKQIKSNKFKNNFVMSQLMSIRIQFKLRAMIKSFIIIKSKNKIKSDKSGF